MTDAILDIVFFIIFIIAIVYCYKRNVRGKTYAVLNIIKTYNETFYYRDFDNKTEFFKLKIGDHDCNSLYEFLEIFDDGNLVLKKMEKFKISYGNCQIKLHSKDGLYHIEAKLRYLGFSSVLITFQDYSHLYNHINKLENENNKNKEYVDFCNKIINSLPIILYGENDSCKVYNQLYLANKDSIKIEKNNINRELLIADNIFQLNYLYHDNDNSNIIIYGFNITDFKKNLERLKSCEESAKNIIDYVSDGILILNKGLQILYQNKQYDHFSRYHDEIMKAIGDVTEVTNILLRRIEIDNGSKLNLVLIPERKNTIAIINEMQG